jgi:hypothetical protein
LVQVQAGGKCQGQPGVAVTGMPIYDDHIKTLYSVIKVAPTVLTQGMGKKRRKVYMSSTSFSQNAIKWK